METKLITLASPKGGVGKSTHLVCLAAGLLDSGKTVRVIDCDEQGNASQWADDVADIHENLDSVFIDTKKMQFIEAQDAIWEYANGPEYVLVDTPGSAEGGTSAALYLADLVLVPFHLEEWDIGGMERMHATYTKLFEQLNEEVPDNLVALINHESSFLSNFDREKIKNLSDTYFVRWGLLRTRTIGKWIRTRRTVSQLRDGVKEAFESEQMNKSRLERVESECKKLVKTVTEFL